MSKQKDRLRRKKQETSQLRWLIAAEAALIILGGKWVALSNRQSINPRAQLISNLSTADFHSIAFYPTEPDTVYFGHYGGLLVTQNGGKDWEPTTLENADVMAVAMPLSD